VLAIIRSQPDGFVLQIVGRANEADRFAFGAHQDRMGNRGRALRFHATQERAVADAGGAKNDVFAIGEIVRLKDAPEIVLATFID
jgi:hypothetical protein